MAIDWEPILWKLSKAYCGKSGAKWANLRRGMKHGDGSRAKDYKQSACCEETQPK